MTAQTETYTLFKIVNDACSRVRIRREPNATISYEDLWFEKLHEYSVK